MQLGRILCFCPSGRFFLTSLVLSTWTDVEQFVLVDDDAHAPDLASFSAAIVMDRFVTKERVERLAAQLPVLVLAWNGMFEIERYRALLGDDADVLYVGTDDSLPDGSVPATLRYRAMVDRGCSFERWRELQHGKRQFVVNGGARYRLRWSRNRVLALRAPAVAIAAAAALVKRPRALARTVESGIVSDRLVWAGHCNFDLAATGLTAADLAPIAREAQAVAALADPAKRLDAGLALVAHWQAFATARFAPERAHHAYYVTNTLLRWAVLRHLLDLTRPATWFVGLDNVGLDLGGEIDLYELAPARRLAFLDFGGKTSPTSLYPRALQLLVRGCYVIGIYPGSDVAGTLAALERGLARGHPTWFDELETRRRALYVQLSGSVTLAEAHRRVWDDFAHSS